MIIEHFGNLPNFNCVIKIIHDTVHIIGTLTNLDFPNFFVANNLKMNEKFFINWTEIQSLSVAVDNIIICTKEVMEMYQRSLTTQQKFTYIDMLLIENKTIGCIPPFYRCKAPLKYNLNNSQLILVLCDEFTRNNFESSEPSRFVEIKQIANRPGQKYDSIFYRELNLLPQHFAQGKHQMQMSCVVYGKPLTEQPTLEYRPAREMTPPPPPQPRFNRPPPFEIPFELPPPYMMTPSPSPQRSYFSSQFNPQQFEAHQTLNGLNDYPQGVVNHALPPNGFFPNFSQNFSQNNVQPFWVQSDAPFSFSSFY